MDHREEETNVDRVIAKEEEEQEAAELVSEIMERLNQPIYNQCETGNAWGSANASAVQRMYAIANIGSLADIISRPRPRMRKLIKEHGTSATGSITKEERKRRNGARKLASRSKRRNRR